MKPSSTQVTIPARRSFLGPALSFVKAYAVQHRLDEGRVKALGEAFHGVFDDLIPAEVGSGEVRISVGCLDGRLRVELRNKSDPVSEWAPGVLRAAKLVDTVSFVNRGRHGQDLCLEMSLAAAAPPDVAARVADALRAEPVGAEPELRDLVPGDAEQLSRLFYRVYGYDYINDYVYYPERIRAMVEDGHLRSKVAVTGSGAIVGHVGLLRLNDSPLVYEAALGVVDSAAKGRGLFGRIFDELMKAAAAMPMQYRVYDFVTNHDFSQKLVLKYGYCDLALFLGNQVSQTQAKLEKLGLGKDPVETDRYSLLLAIASSEPHPFGKDSVLPPSIGEACEFLLKPVGLRWAPAPRFHPMPPEGEYVLKRQPEQRAAIFDFHQPGRAALGRLLGELPPLLRDGTQYVAVDVPLDVPGIGQIHDQLARHGFFMAGFVPFRFSGRLAFRFQFLAPTKVSFQELRIASPTGQRLLKMVQADYERNQVL